MIKLLLVEDSPTIREYLSAVLTEDGQIEIIGHACNGADSLALVESECPDVVLMDINMPIMDGLEATRRIMASHPVPVVIMSATANVREVSLAMEAVDVGALALVEKPLSGNQSPEKLAEFIATIKAMSQVRVVRRRKRQTTRLVVIPDRKNSSIPGIIAIATSTGGPGALSTLLRNLPGSFPVPIIIVQHIVTGFMEGMADWLNRVTELKVSVAKDGQVLQPGHVYLAHDEYHLGVGRAHKLRLVDAPPIGGFKPSANFTFSSVADVYGKSAMAIMLTGMGSDGVEGLQVVHKNGGTILAQDESSSVVFGMPRAAIAAGLVDQVLPLEAIADYLEKSAGVVEV